MHTIADEVTRGLVENLKEDNNWRPSDCNTILPNVHWFPLLQCTIFFPFFCVHYPSKLNTFFGAFCRPSEETF